MEALFYIRKKAMQNRIRKSLTKPITYLYLAFFGFYLIMFLKSLGPITTDFGIDNTDGFAGILTFFIFVIIPSNLLAYSKRKGLIFTKADVQFLFSAPFSPKMLLVYAHLRSALVTFIMGGIFTIAGAIWFHVPITKLLLYFFVESILQNLLETSLMMLCYGSERLSDKFKNLISIVMYLIIGSFFIIGAVIVWRDGISSKVIFEYLNSPYIQLVPLIGWNIAFIRMLLIGVTTINIIGSILYFVSVAILFFLAVKMKCSGEYFEDAISFSEEYSIKKEKYKKGEQFGGKIKKHKQVKGIAYKGYYANAIFYRQILEYRKNTFFIFGIHTIIMFAAGVGIAVVAYMGNITQWKEYIIVGVMAYIVWVFSGYATKWSKELENPYTFLLPDTAFRKLWYATLLEHIRSFFDACLLTIPAALFLKITFLQAVLCILVYICLQANKLYITVMAEFLIGSVLGNMGKQLFKMFVFSFIFGLAIAGAIACNVLISVASGFLCMIVILLIETIGCMYVAANIFEKMESIQ